ncbi:transcriptional regulator [Sphingomonas sp. LH128]|uniref:transcriptional regulator n=1 Tax=Sphingomonas sp. LH128 TaxID=473781 RepID=UPI000A075192|nr:YdaS family helix-turn-helix protein [Sphingomonas sp. LH128]
MALEHESDSALAKAVRKVGSQSAFARLIGKRQSVVFGWLKNEKLLPLDHVPTVSDATGIPKAELRPDVAALFESEPPMPGSPPGGTPAEHTHGSAGVPESLKGLQP